MSDVTEKKPVTLLAALLPIILLVALLGVNVLYYGDNALSGANQMALLLSAAVASVVGMYFGFSWEELQRGIVRSIKSALPAILILLIIGALAGTWMISGIVPTMIYYGLKVLNPTFFLVAAVIVSAVVSISTGSSWSTVATVGVALLGIGKAMGIHDGMIAGAIISGAYFGDKMSPLIRYHQSRSGHGWDRSFYTHSLHGINNRSYIDHHLDHFSDYGLFDRNRCRNRRSAGIT
jgi:Na+:H+ antiporter, NhaC family